MRALDRQAYENAGRPWIATLDANITAVFLCDSLRSVQSETKTLARWPGGEERFKNPVVQGCWNSMPIVPDLNQDRFAGLVGMYINATFGGRVFDDRINGIFEQGHPHLIQLRSIS